MNDVRISGAPVSPTQEEAAPEPSSAKKSAVVLVSGGLDSATVLAVARTECSRVCAVSFDYGQRHRFELQAAVRVCQAQGVSDHRTVCLDAGIFRGSALTDDIPVPHHRTDVEMETGIPVTYVPARNTIFLSIALGVAESLNASEIYIGVNAVDYSGYPDCRPEFIEAFEHMANLATRGGVEGRRFRVHTPLILLRKSQIIQLGLKLGVDYSQTHSCYDPGPDGLSCGECDSCQLRQRGFREAGLTDPVPYARQQPA